MSTATDKNSPLESQPWIAYAALTMLTMLAGFVPKCVAGTPGDPANLVQWRPGLTSSAQPDRAYLQRAKALGYDMVINLAPPEYDGAVEEESAILAKQGVTYLSIPVAWKDPTAEDFRLFSEVVKLAAKKNILVHCQVNLRGSSFTFLHRVINEGAPIDATRDKLTGVWMPNPTWRKFIEATLAAAGKKFDLL
jgi:protein tyrosine phosphatase (PTP) superfamily phosphohydrolase (DUF442 family)